MHKSKLFLILCLVVSQNCLTSDYDSDSSRSHDWQDAFPYSVKIKLEKTLPALCPRAKGWVMKNKSKTISVCFAKREDASEFEKKITTSNYKSLTSDQKTTFYRSLVLFPPSSSHSDLIGLPDDILVEK